MAELAKKLHFLKSGTEQTAKAYSTTDEAGDNYIPNKIDGVACYVPIGAVGDAMTTNGRVTKGGTTYAIKSQAKPPYAEVSYTTAGTYTFTVPNGVTRMRVAVCGGGGGGCDDWRETTGTLKAGSGGTSSFGSLIQATGGGGGWSKTTGDTNEGGTVKNYPGDAGSPNGNKGSGSSKTGPNGFALSFTKTSGSYGKGGDCTNVASEPKMVGGSGGYNTGYITVSTGTTYSVTVGAGGKRAGAYRKSTDGNSGFVLIAYGGDI